jgi:hypothetical protein
VLAIVQTGLSSGASDGVVGEAVGNGPVVGDDGVGGSALVVAKLAADDVRLKRLKNEYFEIILRTNAIYFSIQQTNKCT